MPLYKVTECRFQLECIDNEVKLRTVSECINGINSKTDQRFFIPNAVHEMKKKLAQMEQSLINLDKPNLPKKTKISL